MIENLKNLATTFLGYEAFNLFCFYVDNNHINSARVLIEDTSLTLTNALVYNHLHNEGAGNEVPSFQYTNLTTVDALLTEMVINQQEKMVVNGS